MLLHIPEVLGAAEIDELRQTLIAAEWSDGAATSGAQAIKRKQNKQLAANSAVGKQLGELVSTALQRHPLLISAALPKQILPPLFNRYEGGGHYDNHVDNAIQRDPNRQTDVRTDVSITLFINAPEDYDGGELVVEDMYGTHEVKLPAGDAIIYPSTSLHRVEPVTKGTRMAAVTWAQSMVRDDWQRSMLFNLDMTIVQLRQKLGDSAEIVALTSHYHNLLRQWAEL
ncbi:MAG: oxidoreductase, 2OG-Fe(II) oxygenase family [Verrucomicrobiaceae bacterium]|nr:oxidoreductase, 2OG-Fe(II) oxygenase family [Verrucomicrobiaceae bacterium]